MKHKILIAVLLTFSIGIISAQNSSTNELFGAKSVIASENEVPLPNPSTRGTMDIGEGFDDITTLPASGWVMTNNSIPLGTTNWFQGNSSVFSAYDGASDAYIVANFNNTTGTNTISNWLITPEQTIQNGDVFSFYTRAVGGGWYDRLQVRFSINGASTDVGGTATSTGDFSVLLLDINPTYISGVYPEVWTQYTLVVSGLSGQESGRFAFRYFVEDGGPTGANSNYIGIDRVEFSENLQIPISNWAILLGVLLIGTFIVVRYRRRLA